jgi:hypothetical protein
MTNIFRLIIDVNFFVSSIDKNEFTNIVVSIFQDDLRYLKCFSLICYKRTQGYDNLVIPLLRRMSHLEELTLYFYILGGSIFISGTDLDNQLLIHMPRLHTFTFYFASENVIADPYNRITNSDIQRTFTNPKHRQIACMVDYFDPLNMICHVFTLPFKFDRLKKIGNSLPNVIFSSVIYLKLWDKHSFKHEFFVRLARAFPFLQSLSIWNIRPPFLTYEEYHLLKEDWCSIVEYPHLISLDIEHVAIHYIEDFLNDTKTHLPRLAELKITYSQLEMVTDNFTRDETRRNCARVKRLIVEDPIVYPENVYRYFPLL